MSCVCISFFMISDTNYINTNLAALLPSMFCVQLVKTKQRQCESTFTHLNTLLLLFLLQALIIFLAPVLTPSQFQLQVTIDYSHKSEHRCSLRDSTTRHKNSKTFTVSPQTLFNCHQHCTVIFQRNNHLP